MERIYPERDQVEEFLKRRDERSFRRLYRAHTPPLYQTALRLAAGVEDDAAEIVQETWIRAVQRLGAFRWESGLRRWLTSIAVNCFREMVRRRSRTVADEGIEIVDLNAARAMRGAIDRVDLERAIAQLPAGYREVLLLHDVEGYTHEEIGALLDIETGTSKSQLSRARKAMRLHLEDAGGLQDAR